MSSAEEIEAALLKELDVAHARFHDCIRNFGEAAKEIGTGMQHPDGNLALVKAGDQRRRAFNALQSALNQYSNFTLDGIVPEHVRD